MQRQHRLVARVFATVVCAALMASCDTARPSVPSASRAPVQTSPLPTLPARATPVPPTSSPASPVSTPGPSLEPWSPPWTIQRVGPRFDIVWNRQAGADVPAVGRRLTDMWTQSWVELDGTYVLAYATGSGAGPAIWQSQDLINWQPGIPLDQWQKRVHAAQVARGGPGVVALGTDNLEGFREPTKAALWLSSDGRAWQRVPDASVPPAQWLYGGPEGLVAFGAETWTSTDGISWTLVGPSPLRSPVWRASVMSVLDVGGSALVFIPKFGDERTIAVFRLDPRGLWQELGRIPGSERAFGEAVLGPRGIVVVGSQGQHDVAWRSSDGLNWQRAKRPPRYGHLAATAAGYVVVAARVYFDGCAGSVGGSQIPETWTSSDGLRWHRVANAGTQDHQELAALIGHGDALVAVGTTWPGTGWEGARRTLWRAEVQVEDDDQPVGSPVPDGGGCGEG